MKNKRPVWKDKNVLIDDIRRELYNDEIRKEIYGENYKDFGANNTKKEIPMQKEEKAELKMPNVKKPKWAMTQEEAEHLSEEKIDDLLKFAENIDYEKHIQDIEIREALNLIKYKVENNDDQKPENENNQVEEKKEKEKQEDSVILPIISGSKPLEHDQEWNTSIKAGEAMANKEEEKTKKILADEVLKA